jgi:hypothetical protein
LCALLTGGLRSMSHFMKCSKESTTQSWSWLSENGSTTASEKHFAFTLKGIWRVFETDDKKGKRSVPKGDRACLRDATKPLKQR